MRLIDNPDLVSALEAADAEVGREVGLLFQDARSLGALAARDRPSDPRLRSDIAEMGDAAEEYLKAIRAEVPDLRLKMMRMAILEFAPALRGRIAEEIESRLGRLDVIAGRIGRRLGDTPAPRKLTGTASLVPVPAGPQDDAPPVLVRVHENEFGRVSGHFDAVILKAAQDRAQVAASRAFNFLPQGEAIDLGPGDRVLLVGSGLSPANPSRDQPPREEGGLVLVTAQDATTLHGPLFMSAQAGIAEIDEIVQKTADIDEELFRRDKDLATPLCLASLAGTFGVLGVYPLLGMIDAVPFSFSVLAAGSALVMPGWMAKVIPLVTFSMQQSERLRTFSQSRLSRFGILLKRNFLESRTKVSSLNIGAPVLKETAR